VGYVLVGILHVLPEFGDDHILHARGGDARSVFFDDLGSTELDVRDLVAAGLDEGGDNVLGDVVFTELAHHGGQGAQGAHAVIERLFISVEGFVYLRDVRLHDPVSTEFLSHFTRLLDTLLAHCSGTVGNVAHEDGLEGLGVHFFAELDRQLANELNGSHADSPLGILKELADLGQE